VSSAEQRTHQAGFAVVDSEVSCVLTRFKLRSPLWLIPIYLHYRRVRREAVRVEGLLHTMFIIQDFKTCFTYSLWSDDSAIVRFGSTRAHVAAGNAAMGAAYCDAMGRPEIWSAHFRLVGASARNMCWQGMKGVGPTPEQGNSREQEAVRRVS
jgi:hypothetical protein